MQFLTPKEKSVFIRSGLTIIILCFCVLALHAQTDTARIQGTVTDPTGAVVAGAEITVTNTDTNTTSTVTSDDNGNFAVNALPRGNYKAEVKDPGFEGEVQTFTLQISQVQALNFKLKAGGVATEVTVTDAAPIVDLATSSTGLVIQGRQVTELPLNGRNFTGLALLTPGVTRGNYGDSASGVNGNAETFRNASSGGASLSVNGQRPQGNNFILDGVDNNESLVNTIIFFPNIEATEEFRVNTSVSPAEFGRSGGGVVQTSIKSGTNSIHGSLFEFHRNSAFDANPNYQFNGAGPSKPQPFKRNQFGGAVGLPILKDRLFIFGDYQGERSDQPLNPEFSTVPTAKMRTGDFSELLLPTSRQTCNGALLPLTSLPGSDTTDCAKRSPNGEIFDPITGLPFSGNVIPLDRQNPAAINYLNAFPLPNVPGNAGGIFQNFESIRRDIRHSNLFDARTDYKLSQADSLFARFSYDNSAFIRSSLLPNLPAGFASGSNNVHARGYVAGYTRVFTPTIVNELRAGYSRYTLTNVPVFSNVPISQQLGIVNANRTPQLGGGALIGGFNNEIEFTGDFGTYAVPENIYQINDAVSWAHGRHALKFGGDVIRREVAFFRPIDGKGFFQIGNGTGRYTGYEVSELVAGFVDNYQLGAQDGFFGTRNYETAIFAQDDWRLTNRLTLNLGLRYDVITYPTEEHNRQSAFDVTTGTVRLAGVNGNSRSLINTDYGNVGPRFGFAWDAYGTGRTVVRGGYGLFYFIDRGGIDNQFGQQAPFGGSVSYLAQNGFRVTFTGQGPMGNGFNGNLDNRLATNPLPLPGFPNFDPTNPPQGLNVLATNKDNKLSAIQQYNLQVEQQLDKATVLDIAYVGTKGNHLVNYYDFNFHQFNTAIQNFPNLGTITFQANEGISHYNSLQLQLQHRVTAGLQATAAYTWSHSLSNGDFNNNARVFFNNPNASYGNSTQDQPNIFSASAVYDLPFGRGRTFGTNVSRPLDYVLGGWQFNTILQFASGTPFDIDAGGTPDNRPDQIAPVTITHSISQPYFTTSSFQTVPTVTVNGFTVGTRIGNLHRNAFHGPGTKTADASLFKTLPITERFKAELRGEVFNLANTPQFTNPDAGLFDGNFGKIQGTRQSSERQIQLAFRLVF